MSQKTQKKTTFFIGTDQKYVRNRDFYLFLTPRNYPGCARTLRKKFRGKRAPESVTKRYTGSTSQSYWPSTTILVLKCCQSSVLHDWKQYLMFWRQTIRVWAFLSWFLWLLGVKNTQNTSIFNRTYQKSARIRDFRLISTPRHHFWRLQVLLSRFLAYTPICPYIYNYREN